MTTGLTTGRHIFDIDNGITAVAYLTFGTGALRLVQDAFMRIFTNHSLSTIKGNLYYSSSTRIFV